MSDFTLRFATREDAPILHTLIRDLAEYEKLLDQCVLSVENLVENLWETPCGAEALIAEMDGGAVGYALFFPTFSTFLGMPGLHLEDLFVKPEYRGHGIGLALISAMGKIAVERGYQRVEWAVLDWNQPSIELYRSLGAASLNEWIPMRVDGEGIARLAAVSSQNIVS